MKLKTSDLTGAALDWAVAKSTGKSVGRIAGRFYCGEDWWEPSTNWSQGGPLIERFELTIHQFDGCAAIYNDDDNSADYDGRMVTAEGSTVLVAACRCIVAAKIGPIVDVPEELV